MTKEEALLYYKNYFDMDNDDERGLYHDTIGRLERVTRASDVASIVGRLYEVSGINSSVVKFGAFIRSVVTIAENVKEGRSINNVRDHIKNMMFREKWESREKKERERREQEGKRFSIHGSTVTINCAISLDMEKFALFKSIIHQLDVTLSEVDILSTDDAVYSEKIDFLPDDFVIATPVYQYFQIDGNATSVAEVLHRVHDEIGASYLSDISYQAHAMGIEHSHLTLMQAIQLADDETAYCQKDLMEEITELL